MIIASFLKFIGESVLGEFKTALIDRLSCVETKIDGMENNIGKMEKGIDEIQKDVRQLNNRLIPLEAATIEVRGILKQLGAPIYQPLEIAPGSPLKLTEYGEGIAQKVDAYQFIENNRTFLFSLIEAKSHGTRYDVQSVARNIWDEVVSNPLLDSFKRYAFENGLEIKVILNVLGIILRDKYLEKHPEIK